MFILVGSLYSGVHAAVSHVGLTEDEEATILKQCIIPQDLQKKLDIFFKDKDVADIFFNIPRQIALQSHWLSGMKKNTQVGYQQYVQKMQLGVQLRSQKMALIKQRYGLTFLSGHTTYIFKSDLWKGYVIKIPAKNYPSYPKICEYVSQANSWETIEGCVSPYQGVSRVFYAQKIRKFITENKFKHIIVPQKFLYPLPYVSFDGVAVNNAVYPRVCDANYIVVEQDLGNLNALKPLSYSMFKKMTSFTGKMKSECEELIDELTQVITHAGLWCMYENGQQDLNVVIGLNPLLFFGQKSGVLLAYLFDLEKPGLGGSEDPSFFHKNQNEIAANASNGIEQLFELLDIN